MTPIHANPMVKHYRTITNMSKKMRILALLCTVFGLCIGSIYTFSIIRNGLILANEAPFSNPPSSMEREDLLGVWRIEYSAERTEVLVLLADGQCKQLYREQEVQVEAPCANWRIERLVDDRIYLHLLGAKYYFNGLSFADRGHTPCLDGDNFCKEIIDQIPVVSYDWIGKEYVDTTGQLILNIRQDASGEIILLHLWDSSDRGFPIIGGEAEIYRQTEYINGDSHR